MNLVDFAAANAAATNKCKLCKSPLRAEVEAGLAAGIKHATIAAWLGEQTGDTNWVHCIKNHIYAGHVGVER